MFNPIKIALTGVAAWLFFWLITPVYPTVGVSAGALIYIFVCYAGLAAGCYAFWSLNGRSVERVPAAAWQETLRVRVFWITLGIGLLGMLLRFYDRVVLRGADYSGNALEFRETLEQASAGGLSVVASALFPMCFVPLFVLLCSRTRKGHFLLYVIASIAFVLPALESLAQLSRSVALTTAVLAFAAVTSLRLQGNVFNRKLIVSTLVGIVLFSLASTLIFASRIGLMDMQLVDSVVISVYADNLQPHAEALRSLLSGSPLEVRYYSVVLPNGMYYISGLYEFSNLWTRPDQQVFSYGAYNGTAYVRALQVIIAPDSPPLFDEAQLVGKVGVFQTFFGGTWIDFGYFGPVFMAAFGYVSAFIGMQSKAGNFGAVPLYLYIVAIVFFMPVSDFINQGLGNFVLASFGLFAFIFWDRKNTAAMSGRQGSVTRQSSVRMPGRAQ